MTSIDHGAIIILPVATVNFLTLSLADTNPLTIVVGARRAASKFFASRQCYRDLRKASRLGPPSHQPHSRLIAPADRIFHGAGAAHLRLSAGEAAILQGEHQLVEAKICRPTR
jgi:hypothetical protein